MNHQAQNGFMPFFLDALLMCTGGQSLAEVHQNFEPVEELQETRQGSIRSLQFVRTQDSEERQEAPSQGKRRNQESKRVLHTARVHLFEEAVGQDMILKIKKNDTGLECCVEDDMGKALDLSTISEKLSSKHLQESGR